MPNSATMSVLGLWTFNNNLFDEMVVPNSVNFDLLVANILVECSELEIIYPNWQFCHDAISVWSAAEYPTWDHLASLSELEYNPIENYDRHESETSGRGKSRTMTEKDSASGVSHTEQASEGSDNSVNNTSKNTAGYNTNTPVTESTNNTAASGSSSESVKSNSGTSSQNDRDTKEDEQENLVKNSHIHGNIGVTTVAQMMQGELDVYPKINIINYITQSFKQHFCVMVY